MLIKVKTASGSSEWIDVMNVGSLRAGRDQQGRAVINGTMILFKNGEPPLLTDEPRDDIAQAINEAREVVLKMAGAR